MAEYELSPAAERDVLDIALYTLQTWGVTQTERYEAALESHFAAVAHGDVHARVFLEHRPELRLSRCEHHFVFSLQREDACPLILAVFHERMDLMARLRGRLGAPAESGDGD